MMPLNIVNNDGTLNDPQQLQEWLQQLKSGGVDGYRKQIILHNSLIPL
jgi:hypothetical protein